MKADGKVWLLIVAAVCVIYALLRLWHLTDSCLWFDEIFSVHAATLPYQNLFWFVAQDLIHPPLFYVLLKIWLSIGGENLFWLRFFPVLFSILSTIPFLLLCRQIKLSNFSMALGLMFFAANGSLIKYAQEVRMYSLLVCFALFSMWLFVRFLNTGKGFLFLTLVNISLVYTHYFGWLIVASEIFAVLILARERLGRILLMSAVSFLSFTPWIYAVWQASKLNADVGQNIGWMTKPDSLSVFQFIFDLFEPIYFEQSNVDTPTIFLITLPILILGIIAFALYFVRWETETKIEKRNVLLLLIFSFVPVLLAFSASQILPYSIWGTRHLIIAFAPFSIFTAFTFSKIKFRFLQAAGFSVILLLFASAFFLQSTRPKPNYIWCAWENLALSLTQTNSIEPTKIYVFEDLVAYHFWFALRFSDRNFHIIKVNDAAGMSEDKAYFLPRGFNDVETVNEQEIKGDRFFIAFRNKTWDESAAPLLNLRARAYKIGEPQTIEAQGFKAFLVEARK